MSRCNHVELTLMEENYIIEPKRRGRGGSRDGEWENIEGKRGGRRLERASWRSRAVNFCNTFYSKECSESTGKLYFIFRFGI